MIIEFGNLQDKMPALLNNDKLEVFCVYYQENGDLIEPILMQSTCLTDATGIEIYEGDILKDKLGNIIKVEWNAQNTGFWIMSVCDNFFYFPEPLGNGYYSRNDLEVIGNIYENPELLTNQS